MLLVIKIISGDQNILNILIENASNDAFAKKCPRCGGPVYKDLCTLCKKSRSFAYRKKGLVRLFIGLMLFGGALVILGISTDNQVGGIALFGLGIYGMSIIIKCLINLLCGIR